MLLPLCMVLLCVLSGQPRACLAALSSPILLGGDASIGYRDPLLLEHEGLFTLFFTLGQQEPDGRIYLSVAQSTSPDLVHWTPAKKLTPRDLRLNFGIAWSDDLVHWDWPGKQRLSR